MLTATVASENRAALWTALTTLPISWSAVPSEGIALPGDLSLSYSDAPDGEVAHLKITLYASESLEELLDGRGPYTEEELDDPYAVIDEYWIQARLHVDALTVEAADALGLPDVTGQSNWLLPDRTISLGLTQADKEEPIEVCAWLLPPGLTADHMHF